MVSLFRRFYRAYSEPYRKDTNMLTKVMLYMLEKAIYDARKRVVKNHRLWKELIPGYRESYEKKLFCIQEAQNLVVRMRLNDGAPATHADIAALYALVHSIKKNS